MRLNQMPARPLTHEGAPAARLTAEQQLRRSVMACMLWETEFYEYGEEIAARICRLAREVPPATVAEIAVDARTNQHLRHVPLLLCAVLAGRAGGSSLVSDTLAQVIQRADEITEFLAVYAKVNNVSPGNLKPVLSNQVKKGLARAFVRFDAYQLAKYDRAGPVRLRDAMFLCHPKPLDDLQAGVWKQLVDGDLPAPDTWEVGLARAGQAGEGAETKAEVFTRLLMENKLGYMALLRNLRGMMEADVNRSLIEDAIMARRGADKVLPFRYVAAARACPRMEKPLDAALMAALSNQKPWPGLTVVLVDVSGSMSARLSARSDMTRMDAACALAAVVPAATSQVFSFSENLVEVPPRRGMALIDAIQHSQPHMGTYLGRAVADVNVRAPYYRMIVVTDEQSMDRVPAPRCRNAWIVNVASAQNGVGITSDGWRHVNGWSEHVLRYISAIESAES